MRYKSFLHRAQIPIIYLVAGILWISLSDNLLLYLAEQLQMAPSTLVFWGIAKGYMYVTLTCILLYFLISNRTRALESSQADFKRIFEDSPNPMWIYDLQTYRFLIVNKAAVRHYGYSREEFSTRTIFDIRPSKSKERLREYLKTSKIQGYNESGEWLHSTRTGEEFYVRITSHETLYNGQRCRLVTAINVHEKILAEMERRNVQKALNNAALVCMCDLKGNIITVNERLKETLGYELAEMIGKPCTSFQMEKVNAIPWKKVWQRIKKGENWRSDIAVSSKLGEEAWIDMVITPVADHKGEIYKFISIGYEISERKRLESHREMLLEDLAEYAFQTSHELRAPLARMLALISIIDDESEQAFVLDSLKSTSYEMDYVIRKMNQALSRYSQDYILSKKEDNGKNRRYKPE